MNAVISVSNNFYMTISQDRKAQAGEDITIQLDIPENLGYRIRFDYSNNGLKQRQYLNGMTEVTISSPYNRRGILLMQLVVDTLAEGKRKTNVLWLHVAGSVGGTENVVLDELEHLAFVDVQKDIETGETVFYSLTGDEVARIQLDTGDLTAIEEQIRELNTQIQDRYTKEEVDQLLLYGTEWKPSVATFADLATVYPDPQPGWTAVVRDEKQAYTYEENDGWVESVQSVPQATEEQDGIITAEDYSKLQRVSEDWQDYVNTADDLQNIESPQTGECRMIIDIGIPYWYNGTAWEPLRYTQGSELQDALIAYYTKTETDGLYMQKDAPITKIVDVTEATQYPNTFGLEEGQTCLFTFPAALGPAITGQSVSGIGICTRLHTELANYQWYVFAQDGTTIEVRTVLSYNYGVGNNWAGYTMRTYNLTMMPRIHSISTALEFQNTLIRANNGLMCIVVFAASAGSTIVGKSNAGVAFLYYIGNNYRWVAFSDGTMAYGTNSAGNGWTPTRVIDLSLLATQDNLDRVEELAEETLSRHIGLIMNDLSTEKVVTYNADGTITIEEGNYTFWSGDMRFIGEFNVHETVLSFLPGTILVGIVSDSMNGNNDTVHVMPLDNWDDLLNNDKMFIIARMNKQGQFDNVYVYGYGNYPNTPAATINSGTANVIGLPSTFDVTFGTNSVTLPNGRYLFVENATGYRRGITITTPVEFYYEFSTALYYIPGEAQFYSADTAIIPAGAVVFGSMNNIGGKRTVALSGFTSITEP